LSAILRDRGGAIHRQRAGVEQDAIGGQGALEHDPARRRIDPKPAPRRGRRLVVDADRGFDHIAHVIAEFQVGARGGGGREQCDGRKQSGHESFHVRSRIIHHLWISVPVP
jgi:hypothetical protein